MKKINLIEKYKGTSVVARATMWFMICSLFQKGISFLTTPIFARLLSTEEFGIYNVFTTWLQTMTIFSTFRLDYSVFNKGMSKYPDRRDEYTSSMLGLTTIINTVLLILYFIFREPINQFSELNTVLFLCMFLQLYFIPAINFWSLRQRYEFKYRLVVAVTLLMTVSNAVFGVLAVLSFENKALARISAGVLVEAIIGIVIYIMVMLKGGVFWNREFVNFAILFNIPLMPHYFSSYIVDQSDKIMIQKLISFSAAGLYSLAYTVGGVVRIFISALTNTLIPLQYRLLEKKRYDDLNRQICGVMIGVSGLIVSMNLIAPELVYILGEKKYLPAVGVMPPVMASVYCSFLYTLLANIEFFFNKNKFATKISFVGAAVNVVLNFLLIPVFGYVAAAYTTLICYIIYALGHLFYVRKVALAEEKVIILDFGRLILLGILTTALSIVLGFLYPFFVVRYILLFCVFLIALSKRKTIFAFIQNMK